MSCMSNVYAYQSWIWEANGWGLPYCVKTFTLTKPGWERALANATDPRLVTNRTATA